MVVRHYDINKAAILYICDAFSAAKTAVAKKLLYLRDFVFEAETVTFSRVQYCHLKVLILSDKLVLKELA